MSKDWRPYAQHIVDAIRALSCKKIAAGAASHETATGPKKLERIQARGDLIHDEVLYDAALRNLQTLSEAAQRLPDDTKTRHPDIPWQEIANFRNILVHNYLGDIDAHTIVNVLRDDLPPFYKVMVQLLCAE